MKVTYFLLACLLSHAGIYAQKTVIDTSVLGKFPIIQFGSQQISSDGNFVSYNIDNLPIANHTLVIQSTNNNWKKTWVNAGRAIMSNDGQWFFFMLRDSLGLLKMGADSVRYILGISKYILIQRDSQTLLQYVLKDSKDIHILSLPTCSERVIRNVENVFTIPNRADEIFQINEVQNDVPAYSLHLLNFIENKDERICRYLNSMQNIEVDKTGRMLHYNVVSKDGTKNLYSLHILNLLNGYDIVIYSSDQPVTDFSFSDDGGKCIFISKFAIWYYALGMKNAIEKISANTKKPDSTLVLDLDAKPLFDRKGENIIIRLTEKKTENLNSANLSSLTIWSTSDEHISWGAKKAMNDSYLCLYLFSSDSIVQLEKRGESNAVENAEKQRRYVLLEKYSEPEWFYRKGQRGYCSLIDLSNGARNIFNQDHVSPGYQYSLSPYENYLVYFDPFASNFFSISISTKTKHNLSRSIKTTWLRDSTTLYPDPNLHFQRVFFGFAGWIDEEKWILVYDKYDIWALDPTGIRLPINITHGFGKVNHIQLRIKWRDKEIPIRAGNAGNLLTGESIILEGLDEGSLQTSLYRFQIDLVSRPILILKGPYPDGSALPITKAYNSSTWIIGKMSTAEAPNFWVTHDWQHFSRISDLQPQKPYNWYSSELINWALPDGKISKGILLKPENFDSSKKYPIIFNYYASKSKGVYLYHRPEWMRSTDPDIPYFLSRGYLIFLPDIHYIIGQTGKSALDAVESAARILIKRKYVDAKKLGIMGFSFGGFETNYIACHSHLFAAAAVGAGISDLVSKYGWISPEGIPDQYLCEVEQTRIGVSLWNTPSLYIENSPIFRVDKVTLPLLILHNKMDDAVPFEQGVELFSALRRCGKRAWMLQYDNEKHGVSGEKNMKDFTLKLSSFFDYYLMGVPMPDWMKDNR